MIPTSACDLKGTETGLWLEEFAAPYYLFKEKGFDIVVASPAGGPIPFDKGSMTEGFFTDASKKLLHDADAMSALSHSIKLESLVFPGDVDAIYMPGGHGACVDYVDNPTLKTVIETMYNAGKLVTAVCHGPICLAECTKADGKTPLVQGLTVTGFTDSEEAAVQKTDLVPYLIEARFKEQGAKFEKADDWNSKVCVDGNLITGQNPQSSEEAAVAVIKALTSA
jgi:putative intracellular protease/amidase